LVTGPEEVAHRFILRGWRQLKVTGDDYQFSGGLG